MSELVKEVTGKLVIQAKVRQWCLLPYPGHPRGCPNFNKKKGCPPHVPLVMFKFDLSRPHWFAIVGFDLEAHANRMKKKHPDWSDRQARCCLYWQGTVRKNLNDECLKFMAITAMELGHELIAEYCPEAMGVNVFKTAEAVGIHLERNPQRMVYKVALIGSPA